MSDNLDIKPKDEIRKLQSFTSPSGRVVEYALDGRCGNGDPVLFHFHGQFINDIGVGLGPPYLTYKMYRRPQLPESGQAGWALLPWKIVSINRAGYGKSTLGDVKKGEWTYQHFAEDMGALATHLGAPHFAVFGGSSGGPHAIAAAAILKDRVTAVFSLSGDVNYTPGFPKGKKMNEKLAEGAPVTYVDGFAMAHYGGMFGEGSLCFGCCCELCFPDGMHVDLRVEVKPLGFQLADIPLNTAVFIVHGEKDCITDPNCARFYKSQIPHAEITMVPGAGHVACPAEIFDVVMERLHAAALAAINYSPASHAMDR
jgi:pimeloyl-ACP methyl ester carboxylesterase